MRLLVYGVLMAACVVLLGCAGNASSKNAGQLQSYPYAVIEAGWIRDGQPIEYDGEQWFPQDDVEILMDYEVYQIGEYKGVPFFVEKVDIRPYKRLYTKFNKNKFRYYEKKHDRN